MEQSIHPRTEMKETRRLKGGMSSIFQLIQLDVAGQAREGVLRQVHNEEWLVEEQILRLMKWAAFGKLEK